MLTDYTPLIGYVVTGLVSIMGTLIVTSGNRHTTDTTSTDGRNATLFDAQQKLINGLLGTVESLQTDVAALRFDTIALINTNDGLKSDKAELIREKEALTAALARATGAVN